MPSLLHRSLEGFIGFSKAKSWQLFASAGIGAFFGVIGMIRSRSYAHGMMSVVGGATCGLLAGAMLVWKDYHKTRTGTDDIPPLTAVFFVIGFFVVVALAIYIAFLIMTS